MSAVSTGGSFEETATLYPEEGRATRRQVYRLLLCRNIKPGFGALKCVKGTVHIHAGVATRKPLFRAFFRFTRTVYVDL